MIFTVAFWKGLGERAIATFLQAFTGALATAIVAAATGVNGMLGVAAWKLVVLGALSTAIIATVLSVAKSFGNADFTAGTPADVPVDTIPVQPVHANQPDPNNPEDDASSSDSTGDGLDVEPQPGDDDTATPVG